MDVNEGKGKELKFKSDYIKDNPGTNENKIRIAMDKKTCSPLTTRKKN